MASRVDLHTHTTASDGTLTPAELLAEAEALAVRYLAIADHDSTAGYQSLRSQTRPPSSVELIPAIEINAEGDLACHLLGYFLDETHAGLQSQLALYRDLRQQRARAMIEKLAGLGIALDFGRVLALAHNGSVGRPHIADALIEKGVVRTRKQAFERFLKKDGAAYVPGESPSGPDAIALIRAAGGVPVLAHPCFYTTEDLIQRLVEKGLMGLEVYYPEHGRPLTQRYIELAQRLNLVVTGGSDFHGPRTGRTALACVDVPESVIEGLRNAKTRL
jgi:predicted metal-dependent phosphoesterase TrpH